MRYIFFTSPYQKIDYKGCQEDFIALEHEDGWYLCTQEEKVEQLKKEYFDAAIISPFSFLYLQHKAKNKEGALWLFVDKEYIFGITFKEGKPLEYRIEKEHSLQTFIQDFLHHFYNQEENYFVEFIEIYCNKEPFCEDFSLQEDLLLPVHFHPVSQEELSKLFLEPYNLAPQRFTLNKLHKYLLAVGVMVALFLIGADAFLKYKTHTYNQEIQKLIQAQIQKANQNNRYKSELLQIDTIKPLVEQLRESNQLLASKLRNLFDLVPDDTYLTYFELGVGRLKIAGITKKKESFLKSIHKRLAVIYPKSSFKLVKQKRGYAFIATYEEAQND